MEVEELSDCYEGLYGGTALLPEAIFSMEGTSQEQSEQLEPQEQAEQLEQSDPTAPREMGAENSGGGE